MKPIIKQYDKKAGFTIVELLTVMSIIVILVSLLVPSLNMVKRYAKKVKQKNQFHSISVALDLFNAEEDGYPDSDALDTATPQQPYCGAMKLAEAMVGQDLKGFHPASVFRHDGMDSSGTDDLYPDKDQPNPVAYANNLKARKGPYVQLENANANKLKHLYGVGKTAPFDGEEVVLCDVYKHMALTPDPDDSDDKVRGKAGMPILYYRANTSNTLHDVANPGGSIYNYFDNDALVLLGMPWNNFAHSMASAGTTSDGTTPADPGIFYDKTINEKIATKDRPYRADSYILISAGFDGEYGTPDDIFNFGN